MEVTDDIDDIEYDSDTDYDIGYNIDTSVQDNIEDIENFKELYKSSFKNNKTTPNLTSYEKTRVLCERTVQIENGSLPYISNVERFTTSYSIAAAELKERKIPFIIRRPLPNLQGYEYLKLVDMIY